MPRAGGVYTLPAGNPVVTLTVISSSWANTTMSDIATALTGSLPTDGSAPLTGPLRLVDGIGGAPGLTWGSETTSGWYRIGLNQFGFSVAANLALSVNANRGWTIPTPVAATVGLTINSVANTAGLSIIGAAGSNAILALRDGQAGTTLWSISVGVGAVGELDIINNTAGTTPLKISAAGNFTIPAPSAGDTLTVSGFAGANVAVLGAVTIKTAGNVNIPAPTAGDALTVAGFAGANVAVIGTVRFPTGGGIFSPNENSFLAAPANATSTTVLATVLSVTLGPGTYKVETIVSIQGGAGGVRMQYTAGTATAVIGTNGVAFQGIINGAAVAFNGLTGSYPPGPFATVALGDFVRWVQNIVVTVAGTILFQFAQQSSNVATTTISSGSITATRLV